jgi:hypothetical protein
MKLGVNFIAKINGTLPGTMLPRKEASAIPGSSLGRESLARFTTSQSEKFFAKLFFNILVPCLRRRILGRTTLSYSRNQSAILLIQHQVISKFIADTRGCVLNDV